jgi:putative ABC transport system permease protein
VLVLSSAGLIARSLIKLERANLAFEASHLLIGELAFRYAQVDNREKQLALLGKLLPEVRAVPGVRAVSPVVAVPFSGPGGWDGRPASEGQSEAEASSNPILNMEVVVPDYFRTFGIAALRGRVFTDEDREGAPHVVVISQSAARHYWRDADPIGKRLRMGAKLERAFTVVGVVPDTRYRELREARPSIYFALRQSFFPFSPLTLAIRTTGPPADLVPALRAAIGAVDPGVALASAAPFETFLDTPLAQPRLNALLLSVFAVAAVALAAVGLFGVMATMVRQRTRELGVRMALGATARDLWRMVIGRGLAIAATGSLVGLAGALLANRLLAAMLYEVSPTDGATLALVTALLLGVAALASLIPARSSTRIDPVIALRTDG